ncbi:MAG: hypothetical protein KAX28_04670 [Candidatus Marinimicrobia bacterium]|nr:hypothetical protein [Candidatus Neomarinimicrobiota bacterium]
MFRFLFISIPMIVSSRRDLSEEETPRKYYDKSQTSKKESPSIAGFSMRKWAPESLSRRDPYGTGKVSRRENG